MPTLEERVFRLECALEEAAKGFSLYFADQEAFARWERSEDDGEPYNPREEDEDR